MSLPSSFSGTPAGAGVRLGAFSIDVFLIAVIAVPVGVLTSPVLALAVVVEALLGLWILQARLGLSPGAAMLGLRVARDDAPFSPGAGRTFVRGSLLLLGGVVLLAGAWVVLASAAWDRTGLRRSWIDKAAGTLVIAVPARRAVSAGDSDYALASPIVIGRSSAAPVRATPAMQEVAAAALPSAPVWGSPMALPAAASIAAPSAPEPAPAQSAAAPVAVAPVAAASPAAAASIAASGQLLIVFDTGQRAQFPLPVAVNFGRAPVASEAGDMLVPVDDPDRMVSKTHLRLEHDGVNAWVTDAGSTNGSELLDEDGARTLAPGVRTPLDDGDRVRVGERVFTVSRLIGGSA
jgi:hypothetical protein